MLDSKGKHTLNSFPVPSFRKMAMWLSVISRPVLNGRRSERGKCWYVTFGMAEKRWAPRWEEVGRQVPLRQGLQLLTCCFEGCCYHTEVIPVFLCRWHREVELTKEGASNTGTWVQPACHWGVTNTFSWPVEPGQTVNVVWLKLIVDIQWRNY